MVAWQMRSRSFFLPCDERWEEAEMDVGDNTVYQTEEGERAEYFSLAERQYI